MPTRPSHYLYQCWPSSPMHVCIIRRRWVKSVVNIINVDWVTDLNEKRIKGYTLYLGIVLQFPILKHVIKFPGKLQKYFLSNLKQNWNIMWVVWYYYIHFHSRGVCYNGTRFIHSLIQYQGSYRDASRFYSASSVVFMGDSLDVTRIWERTCDIIMRWELHQ